MLFGNNTEIMLKIVILCCVCLVICQTNAFVRRDVSTNSVTQLPNILDSFQKNMEAFKNCIDQSLARTVSEVNEKQLQPVLAAVGDQLNRVSKAYDDLTAPPKATSH